MGFRIPRKSSDEVRSAGKYRSHIPYIYIPTYVGTQTHLRPCWCRVSANRAVITNLLHLLKYLLLEKLDNVGASEQVGLHIYTLLMN